MTEPKEGNLDVEKFAEGFLYVLILIFMLAFFSDRMKPR